MVREFFQIGNVDLPIASARTKQNVSRVLKKTEKSLQEALEMQSSKGFCDRLGKKNQREPKLNNQISQRRPLQDRTGIARYRMHGTHFEKKSFGKTIRKKEKITCKYYS